MKYKVTKSKEEAAVIPDGFYLGHSIEGIVYIEVTNYTYKIHHTAEIHRYKVAVTVKNGNIVIEKFDNN